MKAFEVVLHHVENEIFNGHLRVGSLLPAERALALDLGVSRTVVREAMRTLQAQGIIESTVGAGSTGGTRISGEHGWALTNLMRMHVALELFSPKDVLSTRELLERHSIAAAIEHATPADFDAIASILDEMCESSTPLTRFNELDTDFHAAIATIAGNQLIRALTIAVRESIARDVRGAAAEDMDLSLFRTMVVEQHAGILEHMKLGDTEQAQELMSQHLNWRWSSLLTS
ncbi:MAG: FadR/GntR family transcriptional regulator [Arachnia sp.]